MLGLKSKNMGKQELLGSCLCADIQYVFSSFNICRSVLNYVIYLFIIQLVSNIEGQMLSKDFVCYEIQNDSERNFFFYYFYIFLLQSLHFVWVENMCTVSYFEVLRVSSKQHN